MENNSSVKKSCKIKDFFKSLAKKIDKKMREKAETSSCCGDPKNNSCCK